MSKKFVYKIYQNNGVFLKTFSVRLPIQPYTDTEFVLNAPKIVSSINGGQGKLSIKTNLPFDDFDENISIKHNNKIRLYLIDENNTLGKLLFSGIIYRYSPYLDNDSQGVIIEAYSHITELSQDFYDDGSGGFVFSKSAITASDLFKDIIDRFRVTYSDSDINYDGSSVEDSGVNIGKDYDYTYWNEAIESCLELAPAGWWWSIDSAGIATLKSKPATSTHTFIVGKNINLLSLDKAMDPILNNYYLEWDDAGTPTITNFTDAASKTEYGTRSKFESDQDITDAASRDEKGDSFIADNKDIKYRVKKLVINNTYDNIENIKPGDTCQILGFKKGKSPLIANMQIFKTIYNGTTVDIILEEDFLNFAKQINQS